MRQTSIDAYNTIKENGLLSKARFQVYDVLFHSDGPLTHSEIYERISTKFGSARYYRNNVVARLGELRDMGVVCETGEKINPVTNVRCITWAITGNLPTKLERKPPIRMSWYQKGYEDGYEAAKKELMSKHVTEVTLKQRELF